MARKRKARKARCIRWAKGRTRCLERAGEVQKTRRSRRMSGAQVRERVEQQIAPRAQALGCPCQQAQPRGVGKVTYAGGFALQGTGRALNLSLGKATKKRSKR